MKNITPPLSFSSSEDSSDFNQRQKTFKAFYVKPKTMLMVTAETGIDRANICRYKDEWEKLGLIAVVKLSRCEISNYDGVQFLTTNPDFFPVNNQLKLF